MTTSKAEESGEAREGKKRIPIVSDLFTVPSSADDKPRLIGCRCQQCGEVFFPGRLICAQCGGEEMEEAFLGLRGNLYSYTVMRIPAPGYKGAIPYAVGEVELAEGLLVHSVLTECDPEKLQIGMPLEMVLAEVEKDEEGNEVVTYMFAPASYWGEQR